MQPTGFANIFFARGKQSFYIRIPGLWRRDIIIWVNIVNDGGVTGSFKPLYTKAVLSAVLLFQVTKRELNFSLVMTQRFTV